MQVMLKSILETFFHADAMVRFAAVQVIALILRQGLIHPAQVELTLNLCFQFQDSKHLNVSLGLPFNSLNLYHSIMFKLVYFLLYFSPFSAVFK